jgi:hypothetical protein
MSGNDGQLTPVPGVSHTPNAGWDFPSILMTGFLPIFTTHSMFLKSIFLAAALVVLAGCGESEAPTAGSAAPGTAATPAYIPFGLAAAEAQLFVAAAEGDGARIMDAIELRADINATDMLKRSAVFIAAFHKQATAASLLIEAGCRIDAQDQNGMAPLHGAVVVGAIDVAGMLITKGANINLADVSGHTPLHIAAATGQMSMAELLLQNGANPRLRAVSGLTAAALAANSGHSKMADALKNRPAPPVRGSGQKVGASTTASVAAPPRGP